MPWRLEFISDLSLIDREDWQRCAGPENPFVSYDFLASLEASGCLGPKTGWLPYLAVLRATDSGRAVAVAPSFLKLHSKGEYMFDYHWAEAYPNIVEAPHQYYPKLQVAVPYSPVPGPRLLVASELLPEQAIRVRRALLEGLKEEAHRLDLSGVHLTFCRAQEASFAAEQLGFLTRTGEQYHWSNNGYHDFAGFLQSLSSRKRKQIKKERRKAQGHPLDISTVHGDEATESDWDSFYEMYVTTSYKKWGQPYLNRAFFSEIGRRLGNSVVLFLVRRQSDGRAIAGAWNLRGSKALFGRNWGCLEHYDTLHFEVCYYRAIEYAIEKNLERVEAGAQGTHKIQRGYSPVVTNSCHSFWSQEFSLAIADYLVREKQENQIRLEILEEHSPYRRV